jgi:hypothetical protein
MASNTGFIVYVAEEIVGFKRFISAAVTAFGRNDPA